MNDKATGTPHVSSERDGAVAIIRYDNVPSGLIAAKGAARLVEAVAAALDDSSVRAVVLAGSQAGIFIRHGDVSQIVRAGAAIAAGQIKAESFVGTPFGVLCSLLSEATKPVIAAIDGLCMGGGFEIALACTMRVAAPTAGPIGLPEIRIDIFPGGGGTQRLAALIGRHRARLFMLNGTTVSADEALALGLIDVIAGDPVARAVELANGFARRAPTAIAAILEAVRDTDMSARIDADMARFGTLIGGQPDILLRLQKFTDNGEQLDLLD